jgi:hypothetical protein
MTRSKAKRSHPRGKHPSGKPVWVRPHWRRKVRVAGHFRKNPDMPF